LQASSWMSLWRIFRAG